MTGDAKALALATAGVLAVAGAALTFAKWNNAGNNAQALVQRNLASSVFDDADVFTSAQEARLTNKLLALKKEVGPQLVVTTTANLQGQDIQRFTDSWANRRRIGEATKGEGIVILVAPGDKQVRISYTNNLRGQLSDAFCSKVIQEAMIPRFRKGAMLEGTEAGADAIYSELRRVKASPLTPTAVQATPPARAG